MTSFDTTQLKLMIERIHKTETLLAAFGATTARFNEAQAPGSDSAKGNGDQGITHEGADGSEDALAMPAHDVVMAMLDLHEAANDALARKAEADGPDSEAAKQLATNKLMGEYTASITCYHGQAPERVGASSSGSRIARGCRTELGSYK